MIRNSLKHISCKQRKEMDSDLETIYRGDTVEVAEECLDYFTRKRNSTHPTVSKSWYANWECLTPFFDYPKEIRKVIYNHKNLANY
jgi:putative transposase